ncbi:hypothetical protein [Enterococcus alishanensis]|uniref:Uncharacterized protein n=1 Tax=Enterococcus alishanensis TaxID=1303817 RepID=A0ABS6TGQ1_9ENTE|nr:hypothetical protein [Enterococcus alishanensis]MBV7392134.1 hypothetical protein [Enterococcus alishanensis]
MKKKLSVLLLLFFISSSFFTSEVFANENVTGISSSSVNAEPRAATIKYWFNGIPPKNYNGRIRIDYYKYAGGYIGVYF